MWKAGPRSRRALVFEAIVFLTYNSRFSRHALLAQLVIKLGEGHVKGIVKVYSTGVSALLYCVARRTVHTELCHGCVMNELAGVRIGLLVRICLV